MPINANHEKSLTILSTCSSSNVAKRALDALLNEIFLSVSNFPRNRCHKFMEAERILRESIISSIKVYHSKEKSRQITTYAWLITFVVLKGLKLSFDMIEEVLKEFDRTLNSFLTDKDNNDRNTFRYGVYLARESIKRIIQSCGKNNASQSMRHSIEMCKHFLNSKLEKEDVKNLGKAIYEGGSWSDLHVCLIYLQDLPKVY